MVRPNKGKTETIKERSIYVYLPSQEMVEDWKSRADKTGASISKFVMDRVEDSLKREEGEEGYLSRIEMIKRLKDAEEESKNLRRENGLLKKLVQNQDNELKRYRTQPFLEEGFAGIRHLDKDLLDLLRKGGTYTDDELMRRMGVDSSQTDQVKAIGKQLERLEYYGLVEYAGRGWRWKG